MRFRTKAANDPSLRWDIQHLDLWLKCFPGMSPLANHWPCNHCGGTTHYPINCLFCSSPSRAPRGPQPATPNHQQQANQVCRDFNRSNYYRDSCKFPHRCEICAGTHPTKSCLAKGYPVLVKPPLRLFILKCKLCNYHDIVFVGQLIDNLQQGCKIGYTGPQFTYLAPNLKSASQQTEVIDTTLREECEAG